MLKLVTINIEKEKHYNTVLPFLEKEDPDVICIQEATEGLLLHLEDRNYQTTYAPMTIYEEGDTNKEIIKGVVLASKFPFYSKVNYYHQTSPEIVKYESSRREETESFAYIMAKIDTIHGIYNIATTHIMDTENGRENDFQIKGVSNLLKLLAKEKSHIMCGDFNIPRGYNSLYPEITKSYKDNIPTKYKSSLDRNFHRAGNMVLEQPIFDKYMIDYIFTQPPYETRDVKLKFGVSDHAAVVANILKVTD